MQLQGIFWPARPELDAAADQRLVPVGGGRFAACRHYWLLFPVAGAVLAVMR